MKQVVSLIAVWTLCCSGGCNRAGQTPEAQPGGAVAEAPASTSPDSTAPDTPDGSPAGEAPRPSEAEAVPPAASVPKSEEQAAAAEAAPGDAPGLAVGQKAPAFLLKDQEGQERRLEEFLPQGAVALVFYRSADW